MAATVIIPFLAVRPVLTPSAQEKYIRQQFPAQQVLSEDEASLKGFLGHKIMMPLKFEAFAWTNQTGTNSFETRAVEALYLPVVMVEIERGKQCEMTAVDGRDGTVKEVASFEDYRVNISGVLMGLIDEEGVPTITDKYPVEEVQKLKDLESAKVPVPVAAKAFEVHGIENLFIKRVRFIPLEGVQNAQAFEMECYSDMPIELKLKTEV